MFRRAVCLLKIGIPFDIAWALADCDDLAEARAYIIVNGELEGETFNWETMEWEKPGE